MEQVYQNGQLINSNVQIGNYTSYPSAFLVVNPDGIYSKHYYAGNERIAARMGDKKADELFKYKNKPSSQLSEKTDFDPERLKTLQQADLQRYQNKTNFKTNLKFKKYDVKTENNNVPFGDLAQNLIYYYHLDYLGTANFITDGEGLVYEFFLNLPFGETMAEQHAQTSAYANRWKFTGHELDRETGLYYAGARYYDPKISVFLSVDVLMEKYPGFSPYNYTLNNPINLVDPTGREPDDPPLGMPRKHGTPYSDSTGSWKYDEPSNTWLGQNGSPDIENVQQIGTVEITNHNKGSNSLSDATWVLGSGATSLQNTPGSFRMGTTKQGFSPKYYGNAWQGNQYTKTFNIGNIGTAVGWGTLGLGTAIDGYGVYQYSKNPNHPDAVHPAKMGLNLSVGLYGIYANPFFGILYGTTEILHPNGFMGAWADNVNMKHEFRKQNGYPLIIQR